MWLGAGWQQEEQREETGLTISTEKQSGWAVAGIWEGPGYQLWRSSLMGFQMEWETERLGSDGSSGNTAPNTVFTSTEEVTENREKEQLTALRKT